MSFHDKVRIQSWVSKIPILTTTYNASLKEELGREFYGQLAARENVKPFYKGRHLCETEGSRVKGPNGRIQLDINAEKQ